MRVWPRRTGARHRWSGRVGGRRIGVAVILLACIAAVVASDASSGAARVASAGAAGITPRWPTCTASQYDFRVFVLLRTPCFPPDLGNSAIYVDHSGGVRGTSLQGPSVVKIGPCPNGEGYAKNAWCSQPFTLSLTIPAAGAVDSIGLAIGGGETTGCTSACYRESASFAGRQSGLTGWCYAGTMNVSPCTSTTSERLVIHGIAGSYFTFFACGEARIGPNGSQQTPFACRQIQIQSGTVSTHGPPATLSPNGVVVHPGRYIELRYSGDNWNPAAGPVALSFGGQRAGIAEVDLQGRIAGTVKINYWPQRQSVPFKGNPVDGCSGTLQASQEGTDATAPFSAKAVGFVVWSLDPRIKQHQVYCANEDDGLLFGGGDTITLNYGSNLLDLYGGPGNIIRRANLPAPGQTRCYASQRLHEHVVIRVTGTVLTGATSAGPCP